MNDMKQLMAAFNRIDRQLSCAPLNESTSKPLATYVDVVNGKTAAILDEQYLRETRVEFDKPFGFLKSLGKSK